MLKLLSVFLSCSLLASGISGSTSRAPEYGYDLESLGTVDVVLPGFTEVYDHWHGSVDGGDDVRERYSLLISSMSVLGDTEYIFQLETPGFHLDDLDSMLVREVTTDLNVPRQQRQIDYDIFGMDAISVADGFIWSTDGNVRIVDVTDWDDSIVHIITSDPGNEWFYHEAQWKDMDGDGRKDCLTCRAFQHPETGEVDSQFIWLRHPEGDPFEAPWDTHVISEDVCDTYMAFTTLTAGGDTYDAIFTLGYFSQNLAVYWSTHPDGLWDDNTWIEERIITNTGDPLTGFFDIHTDDVNMDGRIDLLVTLNSAHNGKVMVYEIPDDFRVDDYPEHVLQEGFAPTPPVPGSGSPGHGSTFYPATDLASQGVKPWILVSGDDDGCGYYMVPLSEDPLDWQYDLIKFLDEGDGIVAGLASMDSDGDGNTELYAGSYYGDVVYVYSFVPVEK